VDLSSLADDDGYPEATWMKLWKGSLFVVVQRLDTAHGFQPTSASYVAVADPKTDRLTATIDLGVKNPVTALKEGNGTLYVGCAGKLGPGTLDGGLVALDATAKTARIIKTSKLIYLSV
jgi:hypothetical protein